MPEKFDELRRVRADGDARLTTDLFADVSLLVPRRSFRPTATGISVVRPEDLLVLGFDWANLRVETKDGETWLVKAGDGPAYLIVVFPPQNIGEIAFFENAGATGFPVNTPNGAPEDPDQSKPPKKSEPPSEIPDPPPIQAYIARPSRLVFLVPEERLPLRLSLDQLLTAMEELDLSVAPNARPPEPDPPQWHQLTPEFQKSVGLPVVAAQLMPQTEASRPRALQKARVIDTFLGLTTETGSATRGVWEPPGLSSLQRVGMTPVSDLLKPEPREPTMLETSIEAPYEVFVSPPQMSAWEHAVKAATSDETGKTELWHSRLGGRGKERPSLRAIWTADLEYWNPPPLAPPLEHFDFPWRKSLDFFDRYNVVHLSSNYRLWNGKQRYKPRPLEVDLFMLSALGGWMDTRGAWDLLPPGLSVEEWRHRATMGRDHYVRVVYAGFLFPLGHRASLIKVTERKFHRDKPGNPAYLRQRMFVVVREPVKTYRDSGWHTSGKANAKDNGKSIDLMLPFEAVRITTRVSPSLDDPTKSEIPPGKGQSCFWPRVGGQPFLFHAVGTDVDGKAVDMTLPLIFVGKELTDLEDPKTILDVAAKYETDYAQLATVDLGGQKVAFADSAKPDDTTFEVETLRFGAEVPKDEYKKLDWRHPRFLPVMRGSKIRVPAMQRLARTNAPSSVVFESTYLSSPGGFGTGNAGQVFLAADPAGPATQVAFSKQSDRSGGFVAPDLSLSGLSRLTGPVSGDLSTAVAGTFDPKKYFQGLASAKLFGAIPLLDLVDQAPIGDLAKIPRFVGQSLNQIEQLRGDLEQLARDVEQTALAGQPAVIGAQALATAFGSISSGSLPAVRAQVGALRSQLQALATGLGSAGLTPGVHEIVSRRVAAIVPVLSGLEAIPADPSADLLAAFAGGDILPTALNARFEWRPKLLAWPAKPSTPIFVPHAERGLVLSVEAAAKTDGPGDEAVRITASLDDFTIDLVALILDFHHIQLRLRDGKKLEIDVGLKSNGVRFGGPLSFVETLRELIPLDGFSDPPAVDVTADGVTASYSVALPNVAIGVLSLENLSLSAGFAIPFVGPPMNVWFRFCERENPALLTVSLFGGGAFFGVTMNADGLYVLEAAFEFGAAVSVNLGVASGSVSVMAGIYFKLETDKASLTGYFRMRGEVEALGLVSVCIELYLDLTYEVPTKKAVGTATISVEVSVAMFSKTVKITATKKFAGSGNDPTFAELMEPNDWQTYCAAFA